MEENPTPDPGREPEPRRDEDGLPEADPEWEEAWREMSMEEQDETLERLLATVREHRREIEARHPEVDVEEMIARLAASVEEQRRHSEQVGKAEEAWLQAVANAAEAEANLTVKFGEIMKEMENFTEERWAALPVGMRVVMMNHLQEWQRDKERILSQLPMEERRKLE